MNKFVKIAIALVICLTVGYSASLVTRPSIETWYVTLEKPVFNPPNWIFMPVWTVLYIFMAIAAALVWDRIKEHTEEVKKALLFFIIQLILNAIWSYLFFGLKNPMLALVEIVLLWLMIYETYLKFVKINKTSGYLLIPYLAWVGFATVLNASIWWLNK
ncbi:MULTISPECIES: TspO/MBR family protein [Flavobacterium]|jgi:tryptophan-rich sensory protein|uniref:TspO/MBR family protein n=1 Tax=Flavobacterium TaxID=237 RepID=UPI00202DCF0F|nr:MULTISPECIES: TspO/MBR family protein [Flavobacterium]MCM0665069.1 tryptophan-rich sensory protein [Flavobacterium tyrosinilyticum]WDF60138.1 tryptophan-rich sensory protein [Flavobacterium sp. KACC 22758]